MTKKGYDPEFEEFLSRQPGGFRQLGFPELAPWLTAERLRKIAANPDSGKRLAYLANRLESIWLGDFWHLVLEHAGELPKEEVFNIWYDAYNDRRKRIGRISAWQSNPGGETECTLADEVLLDNPLLRHYYCLQRRSGWEILRHIDGKGRRTQVPKLLDMTRRAIMESSIPEFCISMDMAGRKVSFGLLKEILWRPYADDERRYRVPRPWRPIADLYPEPEKPAALLKHLMREHLMPPAKELPPGEFCVFLVSSFPDYLAVPYLKAAAECYPGVIGAWRDCFGRNLLWYAVHNMLTGWFHPDCRLVPFLLEQGCDPDNENTAGLPWRYVTERLTPAQKRSQMNRRYRVCGQTWGQFLKGEQPLAKIRG